MHAVFKVRGGLVSPFFGGDSEGATPLPIPNRAVKPLSADGTWASRPWESRSPPFFIRKGRPRGGPSSSRAHPYTPRRMSTLAIILIVLGVIVLVALIL